LIKTKQLPLQISLGFSSEGLCFWVVDVGEKKEVGLRLFIFGLLFFFCFVSLASWLAGWLMGCL